MIDFPTVYHGTSVGRWDDTGPSDIHVTTDLEAAMRHAEDVAVDGHEPLVIRIDAESLSVAGLDLQPNLETVEQYRTAPWANGFATTASHLTWRDTVALDGSFRIMDFTHADKAFCVHHEMEPLAPRM